LVHGTVAGRPSIDLDLEARVQRVCRRAIGEGLLRSAHDCADGGLAVALAESCVAGGLGFRGTWAGTERWDAALFGEAQSRIVVSLAPQELSRLDALAREQGVPWTELGLVEGAALSIPNLMDVSLSALESAWRGGLERALG
jgi:phosphoribosylformylglycinamidine synthase